MKKLFVLIVLAAWPLSAQANDEVNGAALLLSMAAICPDNDDAFAIVQAQAKLDEAEFSEMTAQQMFDQLEAQKEEMPSTTVELSCGMLATALAEQPPE